VSRIRQIKPSWFLDKELRRGTSADAREFYIGLWMLADDGGYLTWDIERIAAELYPYDGVSRRERLVATWADSLATLNAEEPHLILYSCGHAAVPKMPAHQRIAGKRSTSVKEAHGMCRSSVRLNRLPIANLSTEAGEPIVATDSHGREHGRERNGTVGVEPTEFQKKVPRAAALRSAS
jgi:hypothetical protein